MKIILITFIFILICAPVLFSAEVSEYRVSAYGITFARATITKTQSNGILFHYVHVKNGFPASLIRSVNNRYLTQIDEESLCPLKQEKYIGAPDGDYHLNLFAPGEREFFGDGRYYPAPDAPLHTLFSLMETIERTRPFKTTHFFAVSCNTLWKVTASPLSRSSYRLTFSSDAPINRLKDRYDDIFLKEVFWNSGEVDLYFNERGQLEKAVLNSFSPPVVLTLTSWQKTGDKQSFL
ncbi:MAG TPA: hypothetical protein ENN72_02125 [Firmicutes bacterium]|nr:hypothetical protein [Bacillota bacterium]